jgi:hypothetical protein
MQPKLPPGKKLYEVTNTETEQRFIAIAKDEDEAIQQSGWQVNQCAVVEVEVKHHPGHHYDPKYYVRVTIRVCPFQFCSCTLDYTEDCPYHPTSPTFNEWMTEAIQAHKCKHQGEEINDKQWRERAILRPLEKVIASAKP